MAPSKSDPNDCTNKEGASHLVGPAIEYNDYHSELEEVLNSIDRSGDYFAEGRLERLPPRMSVEAVGTIAFPILQPQVQSLIEAAERAPYGRGEKTILDRSVRDCWQIGASQVRFAGSRWDDTLASVLERVAEDLGLPRSGFSAQLYKLLVYEAGGFFSSHRDTEKVDGMVATLVISLPVEGDGGELVVRHKDRESVIDLCVEDPGELAFAAFYADCVHSTKPVRAGHRVSLVYNLVLKPGSRSIPATSPDNSRQAQEAGRILSSWAATEVHPNKLVWILEHDYSEAGLGADSMKGIDASVARTLARAAEIADCALHSGILRIEEEGLPDYEVVYDRWGGEPDDSAPIVEVYGGTYTLCGLVDCQETATGALPEIPLRKGEALPLGALDDVEPDDQYLMEATGNEGVSMERSYRRAALVIWPKSRAVPAIAEGSIEGAVDYVARTIEGFARSTDGGAVGSRLVAQLVDVWPATVPYPDSNRFMEQRGNNMLRMLRILSDVGDRQQTARFLETVVTKQYHEDLNDLLVPALEAIGPAGLQAILPQFVAGNASANTGGVFNLLVRLDEIHQDQGTGARDVLRVGAESVFEALPLALEEPQKSPYSRWRKKPRILGSGAVRDLFLAGDRFDLHAEAARAAELIASRPEHVDPYRTLPRMLNELRDRARPVFNRPALVSLWKYSSKHLLARSGSPPPGPEDKSIDASIECDCEHCLSIALFCRDRTATVLRYPVRAEVRGHLRDEIRHADVDLECETERRGRPYTLVCTKTAAGYEKRVGRYAADVESIRLLIATAPEDNSPAIGETLAMLKRAVAVAQSQVRACSSLQEP